MAASCTDVRMGRYGATATPLVDNARPTAASLTGWPATGPPATASPRTRHPAAASLLHGGRTDASWGERPSSSIPESLKRVLAVNVVTIRCGCGKLAQESCRRVLRETAAPSRPEGQVFEGQLMRGRVRAEAHGSWLSFAARQLKGVGEPQFSSTHNDQLAECPIAPFAREWD
jgi:hypothetical protein